VDRESLPIVGWALSNHPNDSQEAEPTLEAISSAIGTPEAAALDAGYFGPATWLPVPKAALSRTSPLAVIRIIPSSQQRFAPLPDPPPEDASSQVKMAYKLRTALDQMVYRAHKCTIEPLIGIIKEVLSFCQFALRGVRAAAGEWCLVCLAFNLKRFHMLSGA
jgi:hypothetical protein